MACFHYCPQKKPLKTTKLKKNAILSKLDFFTKAHLSYNLCLSVSIIEKVTFMLEANFFWKEKWKNKIQSQTNRAFSRVRPLAYIEMCRTVSHYSTSSFSVWFEIKHTHIGLQWYSYANIKKYKSLIQFNVSNCVDNQKKMVFEQNQKKKEKKQQIFILLDKIKLSEKKKEAVEIKCCFLGRNREREGERERERFQIISNL